MKLLEKLLEIRKAIPGIPKDSKVEMPKSSYPVASSANVLNTVRALMDEHRVLLIPSISSVETQINEGAVFTQVHVLYKWIDVDNPEDSLECPWYGQGLAKDEKGASKAVTFSEKTFLLKFFQIPLSDGEDNSPPQSQNQNAGNSGGKRPASGSQGKRDPNSGLMNTIKTLISKFGLDTQKYWPYVLKKYNTDLIEKLTTQQLAEQANLLTKLNKDQAELDRFVKQLTEGK